MPMSSKKPDLAAQLLRRLRWEEIDPAYVGRLIDMAREEDLEGAGLRKKPDDTGDLTTLAVIGQGRAKANVVAKENLHLCGLPLVPMVLQAYGTEVSCRFLRQDGESVPAGTPVAQIEGPAAVLLQAERVLLNFLQHLCGVATETARHVSALGDSPTRLLDTRKTTPGWRMLEKYAVASGGGWNHRLGLFDRVMVKDNHLAAAQSTSGERLSDAVRRARSATPNVPVEVEVDCLAQIDPVLAAGAEVILLDNFSPNDLAGAVRLINGRAWTEASGGISLASLPFLRDIGLDFVSCGAVVHQSTWKDIGLEWGLIRSSKTCHGSRIMKPHHLPLLLSIGLSPLANALPDQTEGVSLRVMVYNIAAGHGDLARIAEVIREQQPDVVGLQEVDKHWSGRSNWEDQTTRLAKELGMEGFYAPIYRLPHPEEGRPEREYGLAFLSRLPITHSLNHPVSRLSTQSPDARPEPKPGFPEITLEIGNRTVRFFNTHLDYRGDPRVRQMQVAETLAIIGEVKEPTVLMGDLNARPDQAEIQPLRKLLRDAWDEKKLGPGHTFPANQPDRRIDYLLVSDHFEVKQAAVIPTDASDHLPLVFDLILRPKPPAR